MVLAADDSVPFLLALVLGLSMVAGAVVIALTTNKAIDGTLGPNRTAGFRTKDTLASPEAWQAGHRAARPWAQFASMIGFVTGVVVIALSSSAVALFTVLLVGAGLMVVVLVAATGAANRAAREVERSA